MQLEFCQFHPFLLIYLLKLSLHPMWPWTYDPELESHILFWLSQPETPISPFWSSNSQRFPAKSNWNWFLSVLSSWPCSFSTILGFSYLHIWYLLCFLYFTIASLVYFFLLVGHTSRVVLRKGSWKVLFLRLSMSEIIFVLFTHLVDSWLDMEY